MIRVFMPTFTLTQIAAALAIPQHRLIHLCEKGVVEPDLGEATGRGSSRRFSATNVLEFGVALEFRKLELPITAVQHVVAALRSFFRVLGRTGTRVPEDLLGADSSVAVEIMDGQHLLFVQGSGRRATRVMTGPDLYPSAEGDPRRTVLRKSSGEELRHLVEGARSHVHVDVTRIARDLDAKLGLTDDPA